MKVKFLPQNIELEIKPDQTLKELADSNGVFVKSICNGVPSCAECRVRIVEGEGNILPPGIKELSLIGTGHFIDMRRLSCQVRCFGDITVDLSEQVEKQQQLGQRKPQGFKGDVERTSHAVGGNLLEQENVLSKTVEETQRSQEQPKRQHNEPSRQRHDQGHKGHKGNNRQSHQRSDRRPK